MKNIVLFGPPGAGKGTQARMLKEKYGFEHISTGEIIREEIRRGTPHGLMVREGIERGELAPDELVLEIITDHIEHNRRGAGNIFDGFPRTVRQAEEFDDILAAHSLKVDIMLSLEVPDPVLVERIGIRSAQSGRNDDSRKEVILNRIEVYKRRTAIVASYYERQGKYFAVDGLGTVEEVFERLCEQIDRIAEGER
jgi:adenylate kinase